jgi:hypothetical protein
MNDWVHKTRVFAKLILPYAYMTIVNVYFFFGEHIDNVLYFKLTRIQHILLYTLTYIPGDWQWIWPGKNETLTIFSHFEFQGFMLFKDSFLWSVLFFFLHALALSVRQFLSQYFRRFIQFNKLLLILFTDICIWCFEFSYFIILIYRYLGAVWWPWIQVYWLHWHWH